MTTRRILRFIVLQTILLDTMKLTIPQESFSKALNIASRFTTPKVQLPILANVYLSAKKNSLTISATNLEISVSLQIPAEITEDGDITIPARTLTDIVSNLKKGEVSLSTDDNLVLIKASGFNGKVTGMNGDDFPVVPKELGKTPISIATADFSNALSKMLYAVSVDESRPILTGVLCILKDKELTLVSTDGFRLSKTTLQLQNEGEGTFIVPKGIVSEIVRTKDEGDTLSFSYTKEENQFICKIGNTILSSRLIDGNFPDFDRIIPKTTTTTITVGKGDLLRAVKIASIFAKDSANVIKIKVGESDISISADSSQKGNEETTIEAEVTSTEKHVIPSKEGNHTNNETSIAYNCKFIEDFLSNMVGDELSVSLTNPSAPTIFSDLKDTGFLHIIMPIKLQS
jgi:DNA polymerase-3 subunit beta